jgi:hypothetical protein
MLNKVFAGLVIAFWAAMMTALLRVEFFPKPAADASISTQRVLKKVFSNPEPVRLVVFYKTYRIGKCQIDIQPQPGDKRGNDLPVGQGPGGYDVRSHLWVRLWVFGIPSKLSLEGTSAFNKKLELENFEIKTTIGDGSDSDGHINIKGDDRTKKVQVECDFGESSNRRTFDFDQIKGAGLASAFGLPGMANFSFLGGGGLPGSEAAEPRSRPVTTTYFDRLEIAGNSQAVYLMYSKIDDRIWTKMWVDDSGQVLKVVTSLGLEMRSDLPYGMDDQVNRAVRRGHPGSRR